MIPDTAVDGKFLASFGITLGWLRKGTDGFRRRICPYRSAPWPTSLSVTTHVPVHRLTVTVHPGEWGEESAGEETDAALTETLAVLLVLFGRLRYT